MGGTYYSDARAEGLVGSRKGRYKTRDEDRPRVVGVRSLPKLGTQSLGGSLG